MTPKEQAKDLYDMMKGFRVTNIHRKKCALKAAEEIIENLYQYFHRHSVWLCGVMLEKWHDTKECKHWSEVIREIKKL